MVRGVFLSLFLKKLALGCAAACSAAFVEALQKFFAAAGGASSDGLSDFI